MASRTPCRINDEVFFDSSEEDEEEEEEEEEEGEEADERTRSWDITSMSVNTLEDLPWFHPDMSRNKAEAILLANGREGSFLLRHKSSLDPYHYSVSARCQDSVKHYELKYQPRNKSYLFGKGEFQNIAELVDHFESQPVLSNVYGETIILRHPYTRNVDEPHFYEDIRTHAECGTSLQHRRSDIQDLHIASKEGFMTKRGAIRKNWNKRWFVLNKNFLRYYKTKEHSKPIRTIDLQNAKEVSVSFIDKKKNCFQLVLPYRTFYIHGKDIAEARQWMDILQWKIDHYQRERAGSATL